MSSSIKPQRLIALYLILFSLLAVSLAGAEETPLPVATTTNTVQGIIRDTYMEVLQREPDEAGLQTYTQ